MKAAQPCGATNDFRSVDRRLEPRLKQPALDRYRLGDRLMAMVGADDEQHLVAFVTQPLDRFGNLTDQAVGSGQGCEMDLRPERCGMHRLVRL